MFDAAYYCRMAPDVAESGWTAMRHYLLRGQFRGLTPHPLFDPDWYRTTYHDIGGQDPFLHYIRQGRAEDRRPNAFFDPAWYRQQHPNVTASSQDPLLHFIRLGASLRYDPSPLFQIGFYLDRYSDVAAGGMNPLAHYLVHGLREGRTISSATVNAKPVDRTPIEVRKRPQGGPDIALLVTHSPNGQLRPHVRHYLQALKYEGVAVTLIVAADCGFTQDEPWLYELVDGLYVRTNEGWDFACWAHVLRLNRAFYRAETLYWLNDSLIGPTNQSAFHAVLEHVRASDSGMVGLTGSLEQAYHVQSFFLAFKPGALQSAAFQQFVLGIQSLRNKEDVIDAYELKLTAYLRAAGIPTSAVFEPTGRDNPVIHNWKALLEAGFPFLKVAAITHNQERADKTGWREALDQHGFDVALADALLAQREVLPSAAVESAHRPSLANEPPQLTFIGPSNYGNGLGVAARGYMAALMHLGLPTTMLPIERPFHIHQRVTPTLPSTECVGPGDVALVHLNPDAWEVMLTPSQSAIIDAAEHRIGLFVWESQDIPRSFIPITRRLSALWVPSRYCAEGFRRVSEAPVSVIPYAVPIPTSRVAPMRVVRLKQDLGIALASRVILFSFDASSYLARKNPHALVRAFDQSGLAGAGWRLVLKTKHLHGTQADGRALLEMAERSSGTLLLNRSIGVEAARTLLDMADIYASPHASEGFGLTIAEAMAMGKPVVASNFGGSTDFLDDSCGFPVPCTPWQLQEDDGAYLRGTTWGRIDEDRLAETLVTVASLSAPALAELGVKARQRIEGQLSPRAVANRMRAAIDDVLAC
jgi:glycosyltransferase involved in cell wall biosynthesis